MFLVRNSGKKKHDLWDCLWRICIVSNLYYFNKQIPLYIKLTCVFCLLNSSVLVIIEKFSSLSLRWVFLYLWSTESQKRNYFPSMSCYSTLLTFVIHIHFKYQKLKNYAFMWLKEHSNFHFPWFPARRGGSLQNKVTMMWDFISHIENLQWRV